MIRVIYTWKVSARDRAEFVARWRQVTTSIHETTEGALGSFCLQSAEDEETILTVALWRSEDGWRDFVGAARTGSMKLLHEIATQVSAVPYRQLGDETVTP